MRNRAALAARPASPGVVLSAIALDCFFLIFSPTPVEFQSLLQSIFGFGSRSYPLRTSPFTFNPQYSRDPYGEYSEGPVVGGGTYRTLCVRTCDGFYWPISHGVSRGRFYQDAKTCQASCGTEARLFYQFAGETDPEAMVDLTGRAYTQLPNALRYRKALVDGCGCKPAPWSAAEAARHNQYAAAKARTTPRPQQTGPIAQGGTSNSAPGTMSGTTSTMTAEAVPNEAEGAQVPDRGLDTGPLARPPLQAYTPEVGSYLPPEPVARPMVRTKDSSRRSGGAPVYSHDLGRFVFPGEGAYR